MATLNEILTYGNELDPATGQPRANAMQQAEAVRAWHRETVDYGRAAVADTTNPLPADDFWKGTLAVDDEVTQTLEALRTTAMADTATTLFQDPAELQSFWRVWESSGKDPENMDAPERWIANARAIDQVGQARAFQAPRYQSGQIGIGPNVLGHYLIREKEDGTGYQSYVQSAIPTKQEIKQADGTTKTVEALPPPITVDLPTIEAMRQKANERLAKTSQDWNLYQPRERAPVPGAGMFDAFVQSNEAREYEKRFLSAKSRADLINSKDLATALHVGLDDNLTQNAAFLDQLPGGVGAWAEQLTLRPMNQVARGLAQAYAALPGTDNRALTQEGQDAVETVTPGALANRYENSPTGTTPIADMITSGIESAVTMIGPGLATKLAGRAMTGFKLADRARMGTKIGRAGAMANAMDEATGTSLPFLSARTRTGFVGEQSGWGGMFTTASGQSYAATEQEATALDATDPARAARLRRWNGLTSLAKGAIEIGTEHIFPGEMALLRGQRRSIGSLALMPFQEGTEEYLGAVAQNGVAALSGSQQFEDPWQAARGGFYGSAPFIAAAASAGRFSPQPAAPADPNQAPPAAPPADPNAPAPGPDGTLFPNVNVNPQDANGPAPTALAGIAQRGGREDSSQISNLPPIPTAGRTTAYGYANDETPDANSSAGIGAFVSSAEAEKIKRGEPSEMRLRSGDLAVSRDIEAQFRAQGIRPGDAVTLHYADGTTHTGRWMDRTDGSLDGRFDLYSPNGPPSNDGSKITGFNPGGSVQDPSTINSQPSTIPDTPEDLEDGSPNLHPNGVTPAEVLTFQTAQDDHLARNPDTATQPESLRTLDAQLDLVKDGGKPSMIFEGLTRDQLPARMRPIAGRESPIDGVQTPGGYVIFNKAAIRPALGLRAADPYTSVQAAARQAFSNPATAGQLLGYGTAEKPADADHAQVIRAADGTEVLAVAANAATAEPTAQALDRAVSRRAQSASNAAFREMPLAQFVIQSGGIMSRSTARKEGLYRRSKSLWDDAPQRLSSPEHNAIYGTTAPDELAQSAIRAGLLPEGSTQRELWAALGEESAAARRQATAARQQDQDMAQLERLARREPLDFTLAMRAKSRREESRQALRQTAEPVSIAEPLTDPTDDPNYVPFSRSSINNQPSTINRGVTPKAAQEALALLRQSLPAVADATRIVTNRDALADEVDDYRPQDWADMGPGGVQGFYDPRTGQTTVILENIEVRPGETPLRAVARIILHERIAHAGLATLRENDSTFDRQWQQLTAQIPQAELQAIAERYPELSGNLNALAEEWLAQQVEARAGKLLPANTLAGKLWAALKAALARVFSRHSRSTPLDAEVDRIIELARNALKTQFVPAGPGPVLDAMARLHFLRAFHGTPHKVDKFSTDKIGTGEGAQVYGWGLYFAENKRIAENYRRTLTGKQFIKKVKDTYGEYDAPQEATDALLSNPDLEGYERRLLEALQADAWFGFDYPHQAVRAALSNEVQSWDPSPETMAAVANFGNLYTVDILPNEEEFLDWDKPLNEQSDNVKSALAKHKPSSLPDGKLLADMDGQFIYRMALGDFAGADNVEMAAEKTSRYFQSLGIPGIKYFDSNSRRPGIVAQQLRRSIADWRERYSLSPDEFHRQELARLEQELARYEETNLSRNFVIFDENLIKILEENGEVRMSRPKLNFARPGPIAGRLLPAANRESQVFYRGEGAYRVQRPQLRALFTGRILPKEVADYVEMSNHDKAAVDLAAAALVRDLQGAITLHAKANGLTEADVTALVDAAMQDPTTLAALQDPVLKEATRKARNFLDDGSTAIATITGGQLGSALMANRGHWMRRAYKAFDPAANWTYDRLQDYAAKGKTVEGVAASKILKDAEAYLLTEDPTRTPAQIESILRDLMNRRVWEQALTSQAISKPVDSLMKRKDLAPELRAVMGEETNVLRRISNSAGFQAGFIAKHEMQTRIADLGLRLGFISTERGGVFTELLSEGQPTAAGQRRSGFAGLYTSKEFKAALGYSRIVEPQDLAGWFTKALISLGGIAKADAVALSPKSWTVNIFGGLVGIMQNGHLYDHRIVSRWQEAYRIRASSKDMSRALGTARQAFIEQKREMLTRLTAAGINNNNFTLRDMDATITVALESYLINPAQTWQDRMAGMVRGAAHGSAIGKFSRPTRIGGAIAGGIAGGIVGEARINQAVRNIGQFTIGKSDNFFKVISFLSNYESHLLSGMTDSAAFDLAAEKTSNTMPNYDKVWGPLKSASKLGIGIGSFISFTSELYRNTFHALNYAKKEIASSNAHTRMQGVRRLAGVASVQALATFGIPALIAKLYGKMVGDDEDKIARKWWLPKWNRYQSLTYSKFGPDKITYANVSYLIPQATLNEIIIAAAEGRTLGDGLVKALEAGQKQFIGGGIHTDPILQALANRDGYDQIVSRAPNAWANGFERFLYASDKIFSPGLANDLEKTVRATTGADKNGRTYELKEIFESYLGFRTTTMETPKLITGALMTLRGRYTTAVDRANLAYKLNQPFGGREATLRDLNQTIAEIQSDYATFTQDMAKIGMTELTRHANADRKNKAGKNTADIITPKTFRPYRLTPKGFEAVK